MSVPVGVGVSVEVRDGAWVEVVPIRLRWVLVAVRVAVGI